jgi:hypothetical protein
MKGVSVLVLGVSVLAAGCSDSSSPSGPSPGGTSTTTTFTVPLSPANEVPQTVNADASASGTAVIALVVTKDAGGTITSAVANLQINVAGFPPGTTVTDAHIHNGGPGTNAGVYVSAGLASGELALTNGGGSVAKNGISVPSDRAAAILSNPAGHYFNVHTLLNPNGSIRGQLAGGGATVSASDPVPY